ncbi:MAG: hypothetical protein WAN11_12775 [Syntrophobacteraceae bacterium]
MTGFFLAPARLYLSAYGAAPPTPPSAWSWTDQGKRRDLCGAAVAASGHASGRGQIRESVEISRSAVRICARACGHRQVRDSLEIEGNFPPLF